VSIRDASEHTITNRRAAGVLTGEAIMGFFNRKPPEPRMGIRIDIPDYQMEIAQLTRPGLPRDGRYWVAMVETNEDVARLIWEEAATYHEAKNHLKEFEKTYGKKPLNLAEVRIDNVNGVWYAKPRGRPYAVLMIFHPITLKYPMY
jgi:hypothetical protein